MREIKFRAWSPLAREMYKVNSLHFDKEGLSEIVVEVFEVDGVIYSSAVARNLELMQFTGLKDKNGKEIYEGDIVEWTVWPDIDEHPEGKRIRSSIIFRGGAFALEKRLELLGGIAPHRGIEVIGNIYENPELVRGSNPA